MDKAKMYQNRVNKVFHNNKEIYMTSDNDDNNYNIIFTSNELRKKINDIINSSSFIYSKLVHIVINGKVVLKKIVGIHGDNLVTINNEYIPLSNIEDIYV